MLLQTEAYTTYSCKVCSIYVLWCNDTLHTYIHESSVICHIHFKCTIRCVCHLIKLSILEDYCDGTQYSEHPVFSADNHGLQIMLYYDHVEVCT